MSLILNQGSKPEGLSVKTDGFGPQVVYLGDYEITLEDFLSAVIYVLGNTDLVPKDPRLSFLEKIKAMKQVAGYNKGKKRLSL
ncbi:MAG: hypothetical protein WC528_02935 [Patescibacteria group bacterium]